MTEKQTTTFDRRVTPILNTDETVQARVTFYPHLINRKGSLKLMGHYLAIRKGFPLSFDPEDCLHFIGVHECLCLTIRQPRYVVDLLSQAYDLPSLKPFGQIVWLGAVNIGRPSATVKQRKVYIPSTVWTPPEPLTGKRLRTHALVHKVVEPDKGRFKYTMMEFPAFHRNGILTRYVLE